MLRAMRYLVPALLLAAALSSAHANSTLDTVEHFFGASNVNAITGHGRMAVGVSAHGELTVLSWPNASLSDQLGYVSSNDLEARSLPRLGAHEAGGVVLGLLVDDGGARTLRWLRGDGWTIAQGYADDKANVETVYAAEGLRVTVVDAVKPSAADASTDLLVRHVRVEGLPEGATGWLVAYANLSPNPPNSRVPKLPVADWAYDGRNDFAAVWDAGVNAVVHFHPADQNIRDGLPALFSVPDVDYGPIGAALQAGEPDGAEITRLSATLDQDYAPGAYLAVTTLPAPDQHQVGQDATPWCDIADTLVDNVVALSDAFPEIPLPVDAATLNILRCPVGQAPLAEREGFTFQADDAWLDAADGELSGQGLAAGEVNLALRAPLAADGTAALLIAAGPDANSARAALAAVDDAEALLSEADGALDAWLDTLTLPTHADLSARVQAVARRAIINVRVGHVASNGAIVASITRQAPYGLDWPRDGAFFNVLLDAVGASDLVTRRADLYLSWQRAEATAGEALTDGAPPVDPETGEAAYPAHAWEMNYYADGAPGGTFRFEIDNTGFALWTLVAHAAWTDDPAAYLRPRWAGIRAAADLLTRWRDAETGLPAPAQEDDNPAYTQTLHGAVTTFGALDMAARGARLLGEDADAARWAARAEEIRDAILARFYDADAGRFGGEPDAPWNPGSAITGPTAWLVWPTHLLPWDDARVEAQLEADLAAITPIIALEAEGGAYFLKNTSAAALARGQDPVWRPRLIALLERVAEHATPGTLQFGEVMVVTTEDGERRAEQRVSTPHLWEGTLFALTAMALADPAAVLRYQTALPASEVSAPPAPGDAPGADAGAVELAPPVVVDAGPPETDHPPCNDCVTETCGCRVGRGGPPRPGLLLLLLPLLALRRRR